jgi:predicted TIM-barrel fold metal-dependent hydrolase
VILDAHVHFWDPAARHHAWLSGPLDRAFGPDDLPAAAPHTTIVLDHLGKPEGLDPWRADLAALAAAYERWFAVVAAVAPEPVLGATGREVYGC